MKNNVYKVMVCVALAIASSASGSAPAESTQEVTQLNNEINKLQTVMNLKDQIHEKEKALQQVQSILLPRGCFGYSRILALELQIYQLQSKLAQVDDKPNN